MKTVVLKCSFCSNLFDKEQKEYTRRLKKSGENTPFFCGPLCAGARFKAQPVRKTCKCGISFLTLTGSSHRSRACASLFSLTEERLEKMVAGSLGNRFSSRQAHVTTTASALRAREWYKYEELHSYLLCHEEDHQFELHLENTRFVYDLALFRVKTLIEFDEGWHLDNREVDEMKTRAAVENGWALHRFNVDGLQIPYSADLLRGIC